MTDAKTPTVKLFELDVNTGSKITINKINYNKQLPAEISLEYILDTIKSIKSSEDLIQLSKIIDAVGIKQSSVKSSMDNFALDDISVVRPTANSTSVFNNTSAIYTVNEDYKPQMLPVDKSYIRKRMNCISITDHCKAQICGTFEIQKITDGDPNNTANAATTKKSLIFKTTILGTSFNIDKHCAVNNIRIKIYIGSIDTSASVSDVQITYSSASPEEEQTVICKYNADEKVYEASIGNKYWLFPLTQKFDRLRELGLLEEYGRVVELANDELGDVDDDVDVDDNGDSKSDNVVYRNGFIGHRIPVPSNAKPNDNLKQILKFESKFSNMNCVVDIKSIDIISEKFLRSPVQIFVYYSAAHMNVELTKELYQVMNALHVTKAGHYEMVNNKTLDKTLAVL